MADFMTNLWDSVFTPGANPTLLLATNATFAVLQLTLAALLAATYSIHFVILSVLCGGLWWSINWFADEVRQAQEKEEEAKRIRKVQERERDGRGGDNGESADDEGEDTETEKDVGGSKDVLEFRPTEQDQALKEKILSDIQKQGRATEGSGPASALQVPDDVRQRKTSSNSNSDMSVDGSTDSEWEKVDSER